MTSLPTLSLKSWSITVLIAAFLAFASQCFAQAPSFGPPQNISLPHSPSAVTTGDFNGDGKLDIAAIDTSPASLFSVILSNGDGTFQPPRSFPVNQPHADQSFPVAIIAGDFDGDHKLDLAIANFGVFANNVLGSISIFLGNGDGTFRGPNNIASSSPAGLAVGDFNRDGKLDLAVATSFRDSNSIAILLGNGDGTFRAIDCCSVGNTSAPVGLAVGDFNNDGILDIAVANEGGPFASGNTAILLGIGNGTFRLSGNFGNAVESVAVADFNNDGKLDFASASSLIQIFLGRGDGTFQLSTSFGTAGDFAVRIAVGDFDLDGDSDIAVAVPNTGVTYIHLGSKKGDVALLSSNKPSAIAAADFNGDHKPDLVVANEGSNLVSVLLNITAAQTSTTPVVTGFSPLNGATVSSPFWVRVNATSSLRITGVIVYVDGIMRYVTTRPFVDAVLPMTSGIHRVTVRAWNNIGQFGTYIASIQVVGSTSSLPLFQIFSPSNNTIVPSPVWVRVNATSTAGITGIIVYIDGASRFTTTAAFVDKTFTVGSGIHFVIVRAWNRKGEFSTDSARVGVP
ncbi:MAG: Alkaline phosphatase [Candidatus Angelobacter sp.]|jgi:hypothetical protein|nr:Alkaline phosphatase [Candidatus Angelobacter sp.]